MQQLLNKQESLAGPEIDAALLPEFMESGPLIDSTRLRCEGSGWRTPSCCGPWVVTGSVLAYGTCLASNEDWGGGAGGALGFGLPEELLRAFQESELGPELLI